MVVLFLFPQAPICSKFCYYLGRIQQQLFIPLNFQIYIRFRGQALKSMQNTCWTRRFQSRYQMDHESALFSKRVRFASSSNSCQEEFQLLPSLRNELAIKQCVLSFVWTVSIQIQTSRKSAIQFLHMSFPTRMMLQMYENATCVTVKMYTKISLTELVKWLVFEFYPYYDIFQRAGAHYCIGYPLLSVNENLNLSDSIEKVVGWTRRLLM